jgi:hypothetical protein
LAIDGNKKYRPCEACHTWFEISAQAARTSKKYCGDTCRIRAYRERLAETQEKARQLRAKGKSYKAIANELKTDAEAIKKWVTMRKG